MKPFLKFVYPYIKEHRLPFLLSTFFILIGAMTQTAMPLYIQTIINNIIILKVPSQLYIAFVIFIGIAILDYLASLGMRWFGATYARNIIESIRRDVFKKLHQQGMEYFSRESTGQLLARTMDDVYYLQDVLSWAWRVVGTIIAISVGIFIVMFLQSPILAIIFGLTFPLLLLVLQNSTKKNAHIFYDSRYKFGELAGTMAENLSGIKTVKSFSREDQQMNIFKEKNNAYIDKAMEQLWVKSYLQPGMITLFSCAVVTFLFFGGLFLQTKAISVGTFIAFIYLILRLAQQMRFLGQIGIYSLIADSSTRRLNDILNYPLVMEDDSDAEPLLVKNGLIEFKNVSFSYPGNSFKSLDNINLVIKPSEKVAILGATGSGKTTLINLIPRFYDPSEGEILIDDKNIRHVTRKSLRQNIQIIHQDNFLYSVSFYENISFGKSDAGLDEVIEYADASQIHEFINSLEKKYDTIVGERGVTLSGGQRQRTTIARGLIVKPKIMIFDDSVSAVDPETESRIQKTIDEIDKDITLIIISQRPSSLKYVDRIIVLDDGKIVQEGSHEQLAKVDGIYQHFINSVKRQVKFINWDEPVSEDALIKTNIQPGD